MLTLPLTLNYGMPVNWQHPLNRGLVSWYKVLPMRAGGGRWVDIANVNHLTLTSAYMLDGGLKPMLGSTAVSATSNLGYPIACLSSAQAWGKEPKRWGLYVTHSTVAALHATGSLHVLTRTPSYLSDV